jgi:hypothetical protein
MPFAEPRPHRRPFYAQGDNRIMVVPARQNMNLAVTSFTMANQDQRSHFVQLISTDGLSQDRLLLEVLIPSETTIHFPFPHPLMVGVGRSLIAEDEVHDVACPMTVVGYEWLADDDTRSIISLFKRRFAR